MDKNKIVRRMTEIEELLANKDLGRNEEDDLYYEYDDLENILFKLEEKCGIY